MVYYTIPLDPVADADMWASWSNSPGRRLSFLRPDVERHRASAYLGICSNLDANRLFSNYYALSMDEQKQAWKTLFADTIKENPIAARIVAGMDTSEANDFYMQEIAQVKLPRWTRGRMALLGDAAACPSPISGMGTTVSVVGAYHLALELAKQPNDIAGGLRAYEAVMRPIVKKAQRLFPGAPRIVNPETRFTINFFYTAMKFLVWTGILAILEGVPASRTPIPEWTVVEYP